MKTPITPYERPKGPIGPAPGTVMMPARGLPVMTDVGMIYPGDPRYEALMVPVVQPADFVQYPDDETPPAKG